MKADRLSNEVPVYAIVALGDTIISESPNLVETTQKPWYHAEFLALEQACERLGRSLDDAAIYVNLEPCPFCAAMMERVRIGEVYYGAYDPKGGGIEHGARIFDHSLHHPKVIGGIQEERCSKLFSRFFKDIRRDR